MSNENDDHSDGEWDEKSDLTRIEDLSEFLHEDDPDTEEKLQSVASEEEVLPDLPDGEDLLAIDELDDDAETNSFENNSSDLDSVPSVPDNDFDSESPTNPHFKVPQDFDQNEDEDGQSLESSEDFSMEGKAFGEEDSFEDFQETSHEEPQADDQFDSEEESLEDESFQLSDDSFSSTDEDLEEEEDFSEPALEEGYEDEESESSFQLPDPDELNASEPSPLTVLDEKPVVSQAVEREDFQDLRDFGNAITYGAVTTGGNPPYSLILRRIKFTEDAEDIKIILREHGLLSDDNEETIDIGLEQGSLLLSQISEYSAIFLAHRLRRFDLELRIGLSDQLHPSKSYSKEGKGLVSKYNLKQNHRETLDIEDRTVDIENIILATTPSLEGYSIQRYLEVLTVHTIIDEVELKRLHLAKEIGDDVREEESLFGTFGLGSDADNQREREIMENYNLGLDEVYHELGLSLKNQAYKIEANGVVGINFSITPLFFTEDGSNKVHYKITCTGSAVWVVDQ